MAVCHTGKAPHLNSPRSAFGPWSRAATRPATDGGDRPGPGRPRLHRHSWRAGAGRVRRGTARKIVIVGSGGGTLPAGIEATPYEACVTTSIMGSC